MVVGFVGTAFVSYLYGYRMISILRCEKIGQTLCSSGITCEGLSNAKCYTSCWIQFYISKFAKVQTVLVSFHVAVAVVVAQNALVWGRGIYLLLIPSLRTS